MISKLLLLLLIPVTNLAYAEETVESKLREAAESFVLSNIDTTPDARVEVKAGNIDPRLHLTTCESHLSLSVPQGLGLRRNTTVYLKCEEGSGWDLYLPVRLFIQKPYVTVLDNVAKGEVLSAEKLTIAYQDEQMQRGDTLIDPNVLVGARSKRELRPGQSIRASQLCVVCKGDQLTLTANIANLQIKSMVRALQDGSFGDTIRVSNLQSGKEVQARVSAVGSATVILP
ncbi:flagellar basal body P-ring formation protein FlgA [Aeromonas simiae]|uniref:Flagella basal body P-ring formation protein FlgA n=1 Tax=Aeromonas simiae TaxID=218936 RepID=A0A5J6WSU9_9GAMM|nr:flagellar basal body P-ring formation protein FlgA [Aeromonas simiae]